ncbi:MAG: hypothetical protein ACPG5O_04110 [Pseudoalteromonas tetraodonis]
MGLTITEAPDALSLNDNGVKFEITADNVLESAASEAALRIEITDFPVITNFFTLTYDAKVLEFVCVAHDADVNGLQFRDDDSDTLAEWADKLVEDLQKNYYLNRDFEITRDSTGGEFILITAKYDGSKYTLDLEETQPWLNENSNTAGVDEVKRDNYQVYLDLFIELTNDAGTFTRILELKNGVDENYVSEFNLDGILDLYTSRTLPDLSTHELIKVVDQIKKFKIDIAWRDYDNTVPLGFTQVATEYLFMAGGTSKLFQIEEDEFLTWLDNSPDRFLTWHPGNKLVTETQPEYLSWLCQESSADVLWVNAEVFYTDGDSANFQEVFELDADQYANTVYQFPCGYDVISGLTHYAGKIISHYDVWLEDENEVIKTERRRFIVDRQTARGNLYVQYFNSFGVIETMRLHGITTRRHETKKEVFGVENNSNTSFSQDNVLQSNIKNNRSLLVNSNPLTKKEAEWAREFLGASRHYLIIENEQLNVAIKGRKVDYHVDKKNLYSLSAELVFEQHDKNYSVDILNRLQ